MNNPVLQCNNLGKVYRDGDRSVTVLQGLNLNLEAGEKIAIVGTSGSGKSTLLNLLGGLDTPSSGDVLMCGDNLALLGERQRCQMRNKRLGFVYQFHHLLPEFDAAENVAMPLLIGGYKRSEALTMSAAMLDRVGLSSRLSVSSCGLGTFAMAYFSPSSSPSSSFSRGSPTDFITFLKSFSYAS